ncbi:hypothetical protein F511_42083 [Dorcoceras hygrometricum]|uniref:Dystroglycan-like n=1 Tax=Dorcoceras hygrometricum TaxID=472368 RepID=A0A2Z7DCF5_9LAMI|nr:hypothetical protein F511_42083 [Dorcoceras hygrometricum]
MENPGMVSMFKSLTESGLQGFLGCPAVIYEASLIEFFENALVRDGVVINTVAGKLVEISEELFAETFELPVEGLTNLSEIPKDLVFYAKSIVSLTGEPSATIETIVDSVAEPVSETAVADVVNEGPSTTDDVDDIIQQVLTETAQIGADKEEIDGGADSIFFAVISVLHSFVQYSLFSGLSTADISSFVSTIAMDRTVLRDVQILQNLVSVSPNVQMVLDQRPFSSSTSDTSAMHFDETDTVATSPFLPTISTEVQDILAQLRASVAHIHVELLGHKDYVNKIRKTISLHIHVLERKLTERFDAYDRTYRVLFNNVCHDMRDHKNLLSLELKTETLNICCSKSRNLSLGSVISSFEPNRSADELLPRRGPRERRASGIGEHACIPASNEHLSKGAGDVSGEAPPMLKSAVHESKTRIYTVLGTKKTISSSCICPADGSQYYQSAVGLVFMESAVELAMETSRVKSVVCNQARAKLNQLEHAGSYSDQQEDSADEKRCVRYGMSCDDISLDVITISSWLSADGLALMMSSVTSSYSADGLSEQSQESAVSHTVEAVVHLRSLGVLTAAGCGIGSVHAVVRSNLLVEPSEEEEGEM